MFPSTPSETGRSTWPNGPRSGPGGPSGPGGLPGPGGPYGPGGPGGPEASTHGSPPVSNRDPAFEDDSDSHRAGHTRHARRRDEPSYFNQDDDEELFEEEIEPVPVRRSLSLLVAAFSALLGLGLVVAAQTAGPGHRLSFAFVIFGAQALFVLSWTVAMRPPAMPVVAIVGVGAAIAADAAAVQAKVVGLAPLGYVAAGGFVAAVIGQLIRRKDRIRVTDSLGATLTIMIGVVAFATLIVLSRIPVGTQAIFVCLAATGVALAVARFVDAIFPRPRLAPQVPRGAAGVIIGAMIGTLAAAVIGMYLLGFTPTSAALVGLVTAASAVLVDLAVGYAEAGRVMAGEAPTMWVARHLQGPLGGFALAAPAAYAMSVVFF